MIHPTAQIDPSAVIGANVRIGAYTVIDADVHIGEGTIIGPHVVIEGPTRIGKDNRIAQFASLGGDPQDMKFSRERTELVIGDRNLIREFVTINRGTKDGVGGGTVLEIDEAGDVVQDRGPASYAEADTSLLGLGKRVRLPTERAGTLLVFKAYDDMSFGLVVGATTPMRVADVVRNP